MTARPSKVSINQAVKLVQEHHRPITLHPDGSITFWPVEGMMCEWEPIETAPKDDGTWVFLYWLTMPISMYPAVGFYHGDDYGWELVCERDYGEVFPTHWARLMPPPDIERTKHETGE